jgi:hypothetical protein
MIIPWANPAEQPGSLERGSTLFRSPRVSLRAAANRIPTECMMPWQTPSRLSVERA